MAELYDSETWKMWAKKTTDLLAETYAQAYGDSQDAIQTEIRKAGIRSRIDNKYSTAAKKAAVLDNPPELTLADLLPSRASAGQKSGLVEKAVNLGLDKTVAESMTTKQLQAVTTSLS
jgi:hypothetical protein